MSTVVAIDGPAGAGKSTIAKLLAERMGYAYVNTGSLYRAVGLAARRAGADLETIGKDFISALHLEFRGADLYMNGEKLGAELRSAQCASDASIVSKQPEVREALLQVQREAAQRGWIVMEGRDIGTVIFPDAEKKFFVTATAEERARRRMQQSGEIANGADFARVLADIKERDYRDSHRAIAPLKAAEDAITVDTTGLTIEQVLDKISTFLK